MLELRLLAIFDKQGKNLTIKNRSKNLWKFLQGIFFRIIYLFM
jgi:hypothetical protein